MGEPLSVPPGFDEMPVDDKIDFVQRLWTRIAKDPAHVPSPAWHARVLDERLAAMKRDGSRGVPWSEVRADVQARLRKIRG